MMMILMTSDDNDSDDIACNHDNEDMMMILMILHAIMIMKIMYEIQHTDFRIIVTAACWLEQTSSAVLLLTRGRARHFA